jgi:hypothetical protein
MASTKTIKPLNLDGLRTLMDLGVDVNLLDLSEIRNLFLDKDLIQDLISRGYNFFEICGVGVLLLCNNYDVSAQNNVTTNLLRNSDPYKDKIDIVVQNIHLLIQNMDRAGLKSKNKIDIIPQDDQWGNNISGNLCDIIRYGDLNIVDYFLAAGGNHNYEIDYNLVRDLLDTAISYGFEPQAFTVMFAIFISDEFKYDAIEMKNKNIITNLELFYIMFQYVQIYDFNYDDFLIFASNIDFIGAAKEMSLEIFISVVDCLKNQCTEEMIQYVVTSGFYKNSKLGNYITPCESTEESKFYEQFGMVVVMVVDTTEDDDIDYDF